MAQTPPEPLQHLNVQTSMVAGVCVEMLRNLPDQHCINLALQVIWVNTADPSTLTQICGWCQTGYRTPQEASACARACREKASN